MKKPSTAKHSWLVWIDQEKAILLHHSADGQVLTEEIPAHTGGLDRYRGEATDKTGLFGTTMDHQQRDQRRELHQQKKYLKTVVTHLDHPAAVRILGPGDMRYALQHLLEADKSLKGISVTTQAADKMSIPMLKAALAETRN